MNATIINAFEALRKLRVEQGEPYRARAYERAINALRNHPTQIQSAEEARMIPGIGESLASKIDELFRTGSVSELQMARPLEELEKERVLKLFESVEGVGPVTANRWYAAGYRRLEDVPVSSLTATQRLGIELHSDLVQRIPRDEIVEAERILHQCLDPLGIQFVIAGSYRRGKETSGDIDVLVINRPNTDVISTVIQCPIFTHQLGRREKKFLGIGKIRSTYRRIDIELAEPHEYPFAIVYFTGPATFNEKMRSHAKQYSLRLNEKGLYDAQGNSYPAQTEQDVFAMLGLQYLTPEERDKY